MDNNNSKNQYQNFKDVPSNNNSINHSDNQNSSNQGEQTVNQQNNNNYFEYQNPQQQVEGNPYNYQQNNIAVVNANPNVINNQNQNPEIIYCTQKGTTKGDGIYFIEVMTWTNALEQIYSELNLVIPNLNLLGQFNFTSINQIEEKVIQQIIGSNINISNEVIRNGKLVYCCKTLQQQAKMWFYKVLASLSIAATLLTIGYSTYITIYDVSFRLVALFVVQTVSSYIQIIILIKFVTKTNFRLLDLIIIFSMILYLFSLLVFVLSLIMDRDTSLNNNIGLLFAIQLFFLFILKISFMNYIGLVSNMKRFLVLVKQLDQTELQTND